jgi:hypothetical protein
MLRSEPCAIPLSEDAGVSNISFDRSLITWRANRFTGDDPTASQSAVVSKTLKKLESRGYLSRFDFRPAVRGEKGRILTTHVSFTLRGRLMAKALSAETPAAVAHNEIEVAKLRAHIQALEGALDILKPLAGQHNPKARRGWTAIFEDMLRHEGALKRMSKKV